MKIGIDFDDIVIDFFTYLLDWHNKKYNRNDKKQDFKIFDWGPVWQVSKEENIRRVNEFHETQDIKNILPMKDAVPSLKFLENKHELIIVTGRPSKFGEKVEIWLEHYLGKKLKIIHAGESVHKGKAATKAEICLQNGISILIEDAPKTALDCANSGINVILFDNTWNKNTKHKNITRVKGWKGALKVINNLENKK